MSFVRPNQEEQLALAEPNDETAEGSEVASPDKPRAISMLGPGLITGASDDDPSGIATYSQVGAQFGFSISWTMLFSYPLMAAPFKRSAAGSGVRPGAESPETFAPLYREHD
jgi:hypothetical protein